MIQSAATKYAIRAVCHLAHVPPGTRLHVKEISEVLDIPQAFLSKILQDLARKGILTSSKGPGGGFEINGSPEDFSLYSLVEAVEGPIADDECLLGLSFCTDETKCPMHDTWKQIKDTFRARMVETSILEVVESDKRKSRALSTGRKVTSERSR